MRTPNFRKSLRFSVGLLLSVTAIIAAYLGGRVPFERELQVSQTEVAELKDQLRLESETATFWRSLAMDSRDDLSESEHRFWIESATRNGGGGSFPRAGPGDGIVAREKRWVVQVDGDGNGYYEHLNDVGIKLIAFRGSTIFEVDAAEKKLNAAQPNRLKGLLVFPGAQRDFEVIPDDLLRTGIDNVVKLIPKELEERFAIAEMQFCQQRQRKITAVVSTEFALTKQDDVIDVRVLSQSTR